MAKSPPRIPKLFLSNFRVDESSPFERYLNRLEVEIGKEDYRQLKKVELLEESPCDSEFSRMQDITALLLKTTQNIYNRNLLEKLGIRVYLDIPHYNVYYRQVDRAIRFTACWRQMVLGRFFRELPIEDTGWQSCGGALPGFGVRFCPDNAGGTLLLRREGQWPDNLPLLTAAHGPFDPHTLEVTLYFLRSGKGGAALINLGFAGREPLTDENLERLKAWGIPLNPSNIDVIYPYVDDDGHPFSYKLERELGHFIRLLGDTPPELIIDIHGCVGTDADDKRLAIGLGGLPPYRELEEVGRGEVSGRVVHLQPHGPMFEGLALLRDLSDEMYVQFCAGQHSCYNFAVLGGLQLIGEHLDPRQAVHSLVEGEERTWLPQENLRWLPGAGANALQRIEARKVRRDAICLHVEIPTRVRRQIALRLKELEIGDSLSSSGL